MTQTDSPRSSTSTAEPRRAVLQPVYLLAEHREGQEQAVNLALPASSGHFTWTLESLDNDERHAGQCQTGFGQHTQSESEYKLVFPPLSSGRYRLKVSPPNEDPLESLVIASPQSYWTPELAGKGWGAVVRLSSLRSATNWGVGDFTDLGNLCRTGIQSAGATLFVLEPLTPAVSNAGRHEQIYTTLSAFDPIYIDVQATVDFNECDEAKRLVLAPDFLENLKRLREATQVDYAAVRETKLKALRVIYQKFRAIDLKEDSARGQEFSRFKSERQDNQKNFALYEALAEQLNSQDWTVWPQQYQTPDSDAVRQFEASNQERIDFYHYLQWLAVEQFSVVQQACVEQNILGLCPTPALAIDPRGCDAWRMQSVVSKGNLARPLGASPDLPAPATEAALIPEALQSSGYQLYIEALRLVQGHCSLVYIPDLSIFEQKIWSSPLGAGKPVKQQYALQDMLAILRVESHHQRCGILASGFDRLEEKIKATANDVADGLLTVAAELSQGAEPFAGSDQDAHAPVAVVPMADNCNSLVGFWLGGDVRAEAVCATSDKSLRDAVVAQRVLQRVELLGQLEKRGLLPPDVAVDTASASVLSLSVVCAFYKMLWSQPSNWLLVALEDLAGRHVIDHAVSVYSLAEKLAVPVGEIGEQPLVKELTAYVRKEASRTTSLREDKVAVPAPTKATIPAATYRLQFNKEFTINHALELVPYLAELGVSHVYASPLLEARPGSMHGYDIVRHDRINPEIGTPEEFDHFVAELRWRGMGIILDMVPNHMGIGKNNPWWMDVLENGPASQFADYFDIDWSPIKPELRGKVTIPILGEFYGTVLSSGQLKLHFYPDRGALVLRYWDNEYPLNPLTYPQVLGERIDILKERLGVGNFDVMEYQSIITALSHLPGHMDAAGFSERIREKQLQTRRLSELCRRNPSIVVFIEQNLQLFLVQGEDRVARQRMHKLLEAQAYRLVHWRVANDEINYRRFFDVNDLAAVRTEDPRVFTEMHALVLKWVEERKIDGLRIDHPDGLLDPAKYFLELQEAAAQRLGGTVDTDLSSTALPFYIAIEKILAPFERLEQDWLVQGTTGYDFLNEILYILVRQDSEEKFTHIYDEFLGESSDYEAMKLASKRTILENVLASELNVLAHRLSQITESSWYFRDFTLNSLRQAVRQIVEHFPIYRTYVTADGADKSARQFIDWAVGKAIRYSASDNNAVFNFIRQVLTLDATASPDQEETEENKSFKKAVVAWAMKFQQFTSPVMAKSVEDTLFYRYTRLACLNEVGGEPERFGASISAFHQKNQQRQQRHPYSMLATSTHDTKRSEDMRARMAVLSELPEIWRSRLATWQRFNRSKKTTLNGGESLPDANDEYLLYQTIVGACPLTVKSDEDLASFKTRIQQYAIKAAREAKRFTSWVNQNEEYETALTGFIERILTRANTNPFLDDLSQFQSVLAPLGLLNSLVQTVLKLTCPGVPDLYQGTELWDFSLVDPDNRRPVDYELRKASLAAMEAHVDAAAHTQGVGAAARRDHTLDCWHNLTDGRLKLYITATLLRLRRLRESLFTVGRYVALEVTGPAAEHVIAFAREEENRWSLVVVPHLIATLLNMDSLDRFKSVELVDTLKAPEIWGETKIALPEELKRADLINLFTSETLRAKDGQLFLSDVFATLPICVLIA